MWTKWIANPANSVAGMSGQAGLLYGFMKEAYFTRAMVPDLAREQYTMRAEINILITVLNDYVAFVKETFAGHKEKLDAIATRMEIDDTYVNTLSNKIESFSAVRDYFALKLDKPHNGFEAVRDLTFINKQKLSRLTHDVDFLFTRLGRMSITDSDSSVNEPEPEPAPVEDDEELLEAMRDD
jgi:hypothetical protein